MKDLYVNQSISPLYTYLNFRSLDIKSINNQFKQFKQFNLHIEDKLAHSSIIGCQN